MDKVLFFLDTSGSTHSAKQYYQEALKIENEIKEKGFHVVHYEWAVDCFNLDEESFDTCISKMKNSRCNAGGTQTTSIIPFLEQDLSSIKYIYIITDGQIDEKESIATNSLLSALIANQSSFPKIELRIFNTCKSSSVDDSVVLPFTQHGNINIEVDGAKYASIEEFERTIESIKKFIEGININQICKDQQYQKQIHVKLRAMTFMSDNKEYILAAQTAIQDLKLAQVKSTTNNLDQLSEMILSKTDINEIVQYLLKFEANANLSNLEQEASRLLSIVNNYRDTKQLIFNKNLIENQPMPTISTDANQEINKNALGFIECPITFDIGVPYLVCNRRDSAILDGFKLEILNQISLNPLLATTFCHNEIENMFGSYFCADPSQLNYTDPRTRKDFQEIDGTILVLCLGTSQEQIKYTNSILFRLFANDSKFCDPDFLFMAIWYYIKYNSKKEYLKDLVPAFEAQLKERFLKPSFLSLSTNTFENMNKAPKFASIWYIINELPYLKQNDQAHASIRRYLSTISIMYSFLNDIFQVNISPEVKNYLKMYHRMLKLKKYKNLSDQSEFWRIIASIKNDFLRLNSEGSLVQLSKDQHVTQIKSVANFSNDTKTHEQVITNRKAEYVTIPIDLSPEKLNQSENIYADLIRDFPDDLKSLKPDELIYLALLIQKGDEFYFNDEVKNQKTINDSIKRLGFDPNNSAQIWPTLPKFHVPIDPSTLRPFKCVNGSSWHIEAKKKIGANNRFISFHRHITDFVLKYRKIPTLNEYIFYIYKREIEGIEIEITFKTEFDNENEEDKYFNKRRRLNVSRLRWQTLTIATEVLDDFSKVTAGLEIDQVIDRIQSSSEYAVKKNKEYYFG